MLDMSNATAGGPSSGILDMIFGSKPKEADPADGSGFGALMKMLSGMGADGKDGMEAGWTEKETGTGKDSIDYRFANIPGLYAMMNPELAGNTAQPLAALAEQQKEAAAVVDKVLTAKMEQVANSSPEMRQLYEAAKALAALKAIEKGAEGVSGQDASKLGQSPGNIGEAISPAAAALAKELAARGVNLDDPKAMQKFLREMSESKEENGISDKLMSTEAYLQMHQLNHAQSKESLVEGKMSGDRLAKGPSKHGDLAILESMAAGDAVAGSTSADGKEAKGDADQLIGKGGADFSGKSLKAEAGGQFAATLDGAMKDGTAGVATKNVFISGQQPEQIRTGLANELNQVVHTAALKGGGEMKMIIHPEALGELRVKVGERDGKVEVSVTAQNEEVAGMLRKSSQDLASSLGDQNLTLSKFSVSVSDKQVNASADTKGGFMEHNLHQQSQQGAFGFQGDGRERSDSPDQRQPMYRALKEAEPVSRQSTKRSMNARNRLDVVA